MKTKSTIALLLSISLIGCSVTPHVVDTTSINDKAAYESDVAECRSESAAIDYSDKIAQETAFGAVEGVATAVESVMSAGGELAIVALPLILFGAMLNSAISNSSATHDAEQEREKSFGKCLSSRGYQAVSAK